MIPDVAVIGAGTAGLAAATALAERGARVMVLEARREAGGRSRSWVRPEIGAAEDNGQHLLLGCYRDFLAFVRRTGGAATLRFEERLDLPMLDDRGGVHRFRPPRLPRPLDLLAGALGLSGFPVRAAAAAAALVREVRSGGPRPGEETVAAWLLRHGQGGEARRLLWDPVVLATCNVAPERACASLLSEVVARALLAGPEASRPVFATRGLSPLVVEPAVAYLEERGGSVLRGAPVRSLATDGRRVLRAVARDGSVHAAGAFVLAVPHEAAADLLPAGASPFDAETARAFGASAIVGVHLWFDGPATELPIAGFLDSPVHWAFERGIVEGRGPTGYLAVVTSDAQAIVDLPADRLAAVAEREVRRFLPGARDRRLLRARTIKERRATPVLSPAVVGRRPGARTALDNLALAGDWTDTGLPATLEGAALSGHRAAILLS